jgi:hypothetical protein
MIHNLRGSEGLNAVGSFPVKRPPYTHFLGFRGKKERRKKEDMPGLARLVLEGHI